MSGYVHIYKRG